MALAAMTGSALAWAGQPVPATIRLSIRDCYPPALSTVDTYSALSLELKQDGAHRVRLTSSQAAVDAELDVTLTCDPRVEAALVLVAARTGKERTRTVRLDDVKPKDRPRALALVAAEFVRREWVGLDLGQESSSQETQPSKSEPAAGGESPPVGSAAVIKERSNSARPEERANPTAPSPPYSTQASTTLAPVLADGAEADADAPRSSTAPGLRSAFSLEAGGAARWFSDYDSAMFGGAAGVDFERASFHLEALTAARTTHLGSASTSLVAGTASWKAWQWQTARTRLALAITGALGVTWAAATPDHDTVQVKNTAALYADLRVGAQAGAAVGPLWLVGGLEAGRAAGMASFAEAEVAGATGGWFVGGTLGAAYSWPARNQQKSLAR